MIATSPANGASLVLLNTTVTANFSSVMAPGTINTTTFTLTGPTGAVAGAVTYSGTTTTFTPATSLAALTLYTGAITTGATDPGGNALQANYAWTFTTGAPTVISTIPANMATGILVNTVVSATFSEPMNPLTINAATFTLAGPGGVLVPGIVIRGAGSARPAKGARRATVTISKPEVVTYTGSTATFTPDVDLAASTTYTATITTGAQGPAGAPLAANYVWTFTTAPPPSVVSTVPANLAIGMATIDSDSLLLGYPFSNREVLTAPRVLNPE